MKEELERPPANADEWSDQQWIDWLRATDGDALAAARTTSVTTVSRVAHSAGGQILGTAMIGLARALYGREQEKPAVIAESAEPGTDQPFELHLDFDHPEQSLASLKPVRPQPESNAD